VSLADDLGRLDAARHEPSGVVLLAQELCASTPAIIAALREQDAWARIEAALALTTPDSELHVALGIHATETLLAKAIVWYVAGSGEEGLGPTRLDALTALADALEAR
jgi:hypothetical protein